MKKRILFLLLSFIYLPSLAQDWQSLNKQVMAEYSQGHFQEGIVLAQKALHQAEKEVGKQHDNYSSSLFNLALFHNKLGEYAEAESAFLKCLSVVEQVHGKDHVEYVNTLCNLGTTYFYQEELDKAETTYLNAKNLAITLYNKNDDYAKENGGLLVYHFANVQNALGRLYKTMGQLEKAKLAYEEAISVLKYTFGEYVQEMDIYPSLLNNLANVYSSREEYVKAEPLYVEILDIQAKIIGKRSLGYITYQNNLASVYKHTKQWQKADSLWKAAMDTLADMTGKGDALYISMLNNRADLYYEQEKYSLAEKYSLEAKKLQKDSFGKDNSMYQLIVFNLAQTYQFMGRFEKANHYYHLALAKTLHDVEKNFSYLTEEAKKAFYQENKGYIDEFSAFALQKSGLLPLPNLPKKQLSKQSLADVYDIQLSTKAIVLNATSKMRKRILEGKDTLLVQRYEHWECVKNEIAQLSATNLKERAPRALDSLHLLAETLEHELASSSSSFRQGFQTPKVTWRDVQKKLKPGEAAVEIVKYFNGIIYVAFIVTPDTKKHPEAALIKSSKDKDLEKQFLSFYKNAIRYQLDDTVSYHRFWKPIADQLAKTSKKKISKVYLSPDGMYNQINLNTLKNPKTGEYVLDELEVHLLTNTKELLQERTGVSKKKKAMLFGRPAYKLSHDSLPPLPPQEKGTLRSAKGTDYADLQATEKEVKDIEALLQKQNWQTSLFLGTASTERNVKNCQNPTVLHLATHGFFLPNQNKNAEATLQSGLVFAGVNNQPSSSIDDGVLTAYEAMNLDLDSTELVVLSACETALGEVETGEGVYGFQRTLKVSGAKSILMSLWQVDDQATQELMKEFYTQWLLLGDKRKAFHKAQATIKLRFKEPKYWGAFVMVE